jgi:hypothetical protein
MAQVLSGNDDFLSALPYELLFRIALQLDFPDIQRLCRVSQVFNELCQDDYFWLSLYRRDISQVRPPPATILVRQSYQRIMTQFSHLKPDVALFEASRYGYERLVNSILQTIPSPDRFTLNVTMDRAAEGGHGDIVNQMLQLGARDYNLTMARAAEGGHQDIVNQMLRLGATDYNWAMAEAARWGHQEIINQMLKLGATDYNYAMDRAAIGGYRDIVKQMLDLGANNYTVAIADANSQGYQNIVDLIRTYQSR